jgi:nitrate reductase gamma subunit
MRIGWKRVFEPGQISVIHQMVQVQHEGACGRCHFKENPLGAASMILPAKSIICMPCHPATFSIGDTTTVLALIVFSIGVLGIFSYWLTGSTSGKAKAGVVKKASTILWGAGKSVFSWKILLISKAIFLDVLLQRRLLRRSEGRWLIHGLIFWPFVFRFSWGILALSVSLWRPEWSPVWVMLDKNHPSTAFLFDLTGIMVILGVCLALARGLVADLKKTPGLPSQDRLALGLIAGIVMVGFLMEGIRIAMTGRPDGSEYAVAGYGISLLFSESAGLTEVYGYIWYIHAILAGAFVAYLPFSRLFHVIMAPVVLAMKEIDEYVHKRSHKS